MVFNVEPDVPDAVIGDPGRLRQILINLTGNAVKFADSGDISVLISLVSEASGKVMLKCDVSDQGIGIAPEQQERIFDAFEQGDASTTKQFGGTGLGLAISKKLVTLMGGEISVTSTPGQGSCFSFTAQLSLQENTAQSVPATESLEGISVLVVDDNAINRRMLGAFLARWQMEVHLASDASEALATLARMHQEGRLPRLLLADVHMPGMDGWQLVTQLRQQKEYDPLQIIIMPSAGLRGDAERCRELRIDGYLTKPVIQEEFHDALAAVIGGYKVNGAELVTRHSMLEEQSRCSILVVDDVEINRELLRISLEKQGHRITMAQDGREAVEQFSRGGFDIVFMDMQMPVLDGYGAVREIRSIETERNLPRTPIIAMTAYAMEGDREKCLAADMDGYLAKPARPRDIIAALAKLVPQQAAPTARNEQAGAATASEPSRTDDTVMIFDRDDLLERLGGREEMLGRFIGMFTQNVSGFLEALETAVDRGDHEQMRIQAHTIKGAAGNISARRIYETASAMESHIREARITETAQLLDTLKNDVEAFRQQTNGQI
jgi:CheY-like chemotaxis protein/HPt (histidine-containing phosphotransfer) domain-containing protein